MKGVFIMKNVENCNIIELFDCYMVLRKLENESEYYGNVDYLFNFLDIPDQILNLFAYVYENYEVKKNVSTL